MNCLLALAKYPSLPQLTRESSGLRIRPMREQGQGIMTNQRLRKHDGFIIDACKYFARNWQC